jgi:adenosine deaminase
MSDNNLQNLPKIELHLHLDCCLSFDAVHQLDPSVTIEDYRQNYVAPAKCANLAEYLKTTVNSVALLQTEAALRLNVRDLFQQLVADNVIYAEIRFAPLLHVNGDLTAEQVVRIIDSETENMIAETNIEARLILCTLRHFSAMQSLQTAHLVQHFHGTRVVALDIAGDEAGYPIDNHLAAYQYAIEHNIYRTAHAGEASGADSVWETLEHFQPTRIGHGVRSIEDAVLIEHIKQENIHLEICPSCNVQIDILPTFADHPIDRLYRQGVKLNVNTDTRAITDINLRQEYDKLAATFGWTTSELLTCNLNAVNAAFIPQSLKDDLTRRLQTAYAD